jgi:hypothetical protein
MMSAEGEKRTREECRRQDEECRAAGQAIGDGRYGMLDVLCVGESSFSARARLPGRAEAVGTVVQEGLVTMQDTDKLCQAVPHL